MAEPPVAARRPFPVTAHGDTRVDDLYWLRDDSRADPEVLALLEAENAHLEESLAHLGPLRERLFEEIRSRIRETDLSVPFRSKGWWYVTRTEEGAQYPRYARSSTRPGDEPGPGEHVLLDLNVLAGGSPYFALGAFDVSPGTGLLLYSTDHDGSERYLLRVRDLHTGGDLPDVVEGTYYGTAWADDTTFLYVRPDHAMRPYQVWRHRLGTDATDDVLVHQEDDERFGVGVSRSRTDRFVIVTAASTRTSEAWFLPVEDPEGPLRVVAPRRDGVEYHVAHAPSPHTGDRFLVVTNDDGAVNFKLMSAPVDRPGREHWVEVEPHRDDVRLEDVLPFRDHLVVFERVAAVPRARVVRLADGTSRALDTPEEVSSVEPGANAEFDTTTLRFGYTSMVTPRSTFDYDLETHERTLLKQQEVLGGYDPADYRTGRLWATAPDGTRVPVTFVARRDVPLDGTAPGVLYAYGSYEASIDPAFSSLRLSLLDRGVVFAVAHPRGGGEMGRLWYESGKLLRKRNTFTDTIACAEHLLAEGFASPGRLALRGGSAGGLLVAAVLNERPDLFAAAVAEVPFVDCLTTILDPSLPLTVGEWEEWGNPVEDPDVYAYMRSYSPYDNVHPAPYPTVLATTGYNDPRVAYWEPVKWVQRLRQHTTSGRPVYLKVDLGAGHMGPSGRYDAWRDEALVMAFLLDALEVVA